MQLKIITNGAFIPISIPRRTYFPKERIVARSNCPDAAPVSLTNSFIPKHKVQMRQGLKALNLASCLSLRSGLDHAVKSRRIDRAPGVCALHIGSIGKVRAF